MSYGVELSPEALDQALRADDWWLANRPFARRLFLEEVDIALAQVARAPGSGRRFESRSAPDVRRLLLPRSRFHIYYSVDDSARVVRVGAIWHSSRSTPAEL